MLCDAKEPWYSRKLFGLALITRALSVLLELQWPILASFNDLNRALWRFWHPYGMERPSDGLTCGEGVDVFFRLAEGRFHRVFT